MEELDVVKSTRRRRTKADVEKAEEVVDKTEEMVADQESSTELEEMLQQGIAVERTDADISEVSEDLENVEALEETVEEDKDVQETPEESENQVEAETPESLEETDHPYGDEDEDGDLENPVEEEESKYEQTEEENVEAAVVEQQEDIEHDMYDEKELPLGNIDPVAAKVQKRKEKEEVLDLIAQAGRKTSTEELLDQRLYRADKEVRRELYNNDFVIPLNGKAVQYKSDNEISHKNYVELVESLKTGKSLTGRVTGTSNSFGHIVAIVNYNAFKILIPFELFLTPMEADLEYMRKNPSMKEKHKRLLMNQRINSEVDFVIRQVDEKNQIAIGDRVYAMRKKLENWYFAKDRAGAYVLNAGQKVEARIVNTTAIACTVEVFGKEYRLKPEDLSYTRIPDVAKEYHKGETIPVMITKLNRERVGKGKYKLEANVSAKLAYEDPRIRYFDMYQVHSLVSAVVTGIEDYGIFTRIEDSCGKVDVLCNFSRFENRKLPKIGDSVLVQIKKKEPKDFRIYGEIMHTLQEAPDED